MSDETEVAVQEGAGEEKGLPVPSISAGSAGEGSGGLDAAALASTITEKVTGQILEALPGLIDSRFKSAKDKRLAKIDEILDAVKAAGGDPTKITGDLERKAIMDRLQEIEAKVIAGDSGKSSGEDELRAQTNKFLSIMEKKLGVRLDDSELSEAASKTYRSQDEWFETLAEKAAKKAKQENISESASVGKQAVATHKTKTETEESIAAELRAIQLGEHGNPNSKENLARRTELFNKLNELSPMIDVNNPNIVIDKTALYRNQ